MDIRHLRRGHTFNEVDIPIMDLKNTYWNAYHIALYYGKLDIAKFLYDD
jgi:hypothetical protein